MTKRVLDVGNCAYDHSVIRNWIQGEFDAEVLPAGDGREALEALEQGEFDLILINRRLDRDGSDGLELLRRIATRPEGGGAPVMLISDYAEYQKEAVAAGAAPGFGKRELKESATRKKLEKFLA